MYSRSSIDKLGGLVVVIQASRLLHLRLFASYEPIRLELSHIILTDI